MRDALFADLLIFLFPPLACGCGRGCVSGADLRGVGESTGVSMALSAMDCPDGLARCEHGAVFVSRLATIPQPCVGPMDRCRCPWERLTGCGNGCAADGVELAVDRARAPQQLCAPPVDAGVFVGPPGTVGEATGFTCEEGERYRCAEGLVFECATGTAIGRCTRGCFEEAASVEDDDVNREAAFAMLCSR